MRQAIKPAVAAAIALALCVGLGGCAMNQHSTELEQAELQLTQQQITLTRLKIQATQALIARVKTETAAQQARMKAHQAETARREQLRQATVKFLRERASQEGARGHRYSELAKWVQAGGDPDFALRAVAPRGLTR